MRQRYIIYLLSPLFLLINSLHTFAQEETVLTVVGNLHEDMRESSGLILGNNPSEIWTHNDGEDNQLYRFDPNNAAIAPHTVSINTTALDWEDLAKDDIGNIYIADFGRWSKVPCGQGVNLAKRDTFQIHKVTASDLNNLNPVPAQSIHFTFPPLCNNAFSKGNTEALLYHDNYLYLFSKWHWEDNCTDWNSKTATHLFRISTNPNTINTVEQAEFLGSFNTRLEGAECETAWKVTAADISPDGKTVALLCSERLWLFSCFQGADFFNGNAQYIDFKDANGNANASQKEGLLFYDNEHIYLTEDKCTGALPNLFELDISPYLPALQANCTATSDCYQLVWADEFDGINVDYDKWSHEWGGGGWGHNELQYYTNQRVQNANVSNGTLKLTAIEEPYTSGNGTPYDYTSARLSSKNKGDWTYGRIEARIKTPSGQGLWPAFWMSPTVKVYGNWPNSGEIDILELLGHEPDKMYMNLHTQEGGIGSTTYTLPNDNFSDDFHHYAIEWSPDTIIWFIDGVQRNIKTANDLNDPTLWPFDIDFYIRLNVAVGGGWPGNPDATTSFPQTMEVDYVRVYQKKAGCSSCNILKNGQFDMQTNNWVTYELAPADVVVTTNEGVATMTPIITGTSGWHLALRQENISLNNAATYTATYTAYASDNRDMSLIISDNTGGQYTYYGHGLSTSPQLFSHTFTMTDPTDNTARFNINVGNDANTVYIDDVSLSADDCIDGTATCADGVKNGNETAIDCGGDCVPCSTLVQLKLFLEGAYTGANAMHTQLENDNLLPNSHPFNQAPWYYEGCEYIESLPTNAVDWVLIEVRDANDNDLMIEQRAALLLSDGSVLDVTCVNGVLFYNLPIANQNNYFISIKTRQHLGVLSANAINLPNAVPYDFTNPNQIAGESQQLTDLGGGVYGLSAGDFNGDGVISVFDFNVYANSTALVNQYLTTDSNLDGNITIDDYNLYQPNASKIGVRQIRY